MRRALIVVLALTAAAAAQASEITRASVVAEMNVRRAAFGLPPLREDSRLDQAADDRISDMEDQGYWAHVSPDGKEPFVWMRPRGYIYRYAGENLASGFETTEVLVDAWMESEGHRANIMSPQYRDCGVSIIDGSTTTRAVGRSIVVEFGTAAVDVSANVPATATKPAKR
jgi:uncharacterized protein YkwD